MKESNGITEIMIACLKALAVTVLSAALLLLICTAIAYGTEDPDKMVGTLSLTALFLSAAIGGIVGARLSDEGALAGAICGAMTALLVFLFSFLPVSSGADRSVGMTVLLYAAVVAAGCVGGLFGKNRGKKRGKKHPKYPKAARRR